MVQKAFVTSIGEVTTNLCVWSLERNGFEVVLIQSGSTLADKLEQIYNLADEDFVRVDADVVVNRNCKPDIKLDNWWVQYQTFGWFKQDVIWGGVQFIKKEALPYLRKRVKEVKSVNRPETELSRIKEFYEPRRFESVPVIMGIHGYKAKDVERIKLVKQSRNQDDYDWELGERLNEL